MILDLLSSTISYGRNKIAGDIAAKLGGIVPNTTAAVSDELIIKENPDIVLLLLMMMLRHAWRASEIKSFQSSEFCPQRPDL